MPTIRALIVDDEPLARRRLRRLLTAHQDVEIIGECRDGAQASSDIASMRPDLVFLDVQMPGMDGFEVARRVGADKMPLVVFVTAFEQFALKAFEIAAIDYLLKPFDEARLAATLQRVRSMQPHLADARADLARTLAALLEKSQDREAYSSRIAVKSDDKVVLVPTEDIDWIAAEGKFVRIHTRQGNHVLRDSLSALLRRLDPDLFARIHRTSIVNINAIVELEPEFHGDYSVLLRNGHRLSLSRNFRHSLSTKFGDLL